jgi:adenine/guanine phosphoribosyltransferase-like PRPP-binding protein
MRAGPAVGASDAAVWDGSWVAEHLGIRLRTDAGSPRPLEQLVGLALRRNPRRAHLLVSHVLGKHIPAEPQRVLAAASTLGQLGGAALGDEPALVLGYAETATGLGHGVAAALGADYLHSTRRAVPGVGAPIRFAEAHSHAQDHLVLPEDPTLLERPGPLVLVDDELSTGATAMATITALHRLAQREHYLLACLVDVRPPSDRERLRRFAAELGARIDVVALGHGTIELPDDVPARAGRLLDDHRRQPAPHAAGTVRSGVSVNWPDGVKDGGRHGFTPADERAARDAARSVAGELAGALTGAPLLVLGVEELMHLPTLIAAELAGTGAPAPGGVRVSSTTRSPVHALDDPGYAVRTALTFSAHDEPADGPGPRFAYNVLPAAAATRFGDVVLVVDDVADTAALHAPGGLMAALAATGAQLHRVLVPSYRPAGAR